MDKKGKLLIISSPSGSGKSTIINFLMQQHLNLEFSISATSRKPRGEEKNGVEYFFLTPEEFKVRIEKGDFLEYVEVYKNYFYGTLKSAVEEKLSKGINVVLDIDVIGACRVKEQYGDEALTLFIMPPSIDELKKRLVKRNTDSPEFIEERIERAEFELTYASKYDEVVVNDILEEAEQKALNILKNFLNK